MRIPRPLQRWMSLAVLGLALAAQATTSQPLMLKCPVCGGEVRSVIISSSNTFGGQDADFFSRAAGSDPVLVLATTCPKCRYSGFPKDFESPPTVIDPALRQKILAKALVVPAIPAWVPKPTRGELPSWARHDLIAQTLQLKGRTERELGDAWLHCSWGVRVDANPFQEVFEGLPDEVSPANRAPNRNRSDYEIELALSLLEKLPTLAKPLQRQTAAGVGYLLRTRGEHAALLAAMPALQPYFARSEWTGLEARVRESVDLERAYQRKSLAAFDRALGGKGLKDAKEQAAITYLTGELARRVGDPEKAREAFAESLKIEGGPEWLKDAVKARNEAVERDSPRPRK